MARKAREQEVIIGEDGNPLTDPRLVQPSPEEEEADRVFDLLSSVAGEQGRGLTLFCYRAAEKNRAWPNEFLKIYPTDTSEPDLLGDIQEEFGAGNYVLLAKYADSKIFKKALISIGARKERKETIIPQAQGIPYDKVLERLTASTEKRLVLDKLEQMAEGKKESGGGNEMIGVLSIIMKGMMDQQNTLMTLLMSKKEEKTSVSEIVEIAKLVKGLTEGKLPEDSDSSLTDKIVDALPGILAAFGKKAQVPDAASARPALPPPPGPGSSGGSAPTVIPPVNTMQMAFNRVLDEIRFALTRPETDQLYGHLLDYTENYMPGSIGEMLNQSEDDYVKWIMQFDPSFANREQFFRNVYKFAVKDSKPEGEGNGNN